MRRRTGPIWIGLLGALILGGCGTRGAGTPHQSHGGKSQPDVKTDPQKVEANLQFGIQLLHALRKEHKADLFFSPLSASLALTMVMNGARGETYRQMANVLGYGEQPIEAIDAGNTLLLQLLRAPDPKTETLVANSLRVQRGFPILPSFTQACQKHYEAEVDAVDFVRDRLGAAQRINGWVKEKTKGLIPELFEPKDFDQDTRLAVVNTLYFKGKWEAPFQKERTREEEFHLSNGTTKRVPMMHQSGWFRYLKGEGFQAVALPYGKGDLSMYLFLPDKGRSLEEFVKSLTPARWQEWLKRFEPMQGDVGLPRFRVETTARLESPLKALGMTDAFDPDRADFSGIAREQLYISKALQKAVVEVNEEGTEAAAATGVEVKAVSAIQNRFTLIANRPFFFAIRHNATGVFLFMGIVAEL